MASVPAIVIIEGALKALDAIRAMRAALEITRDDFALVPSPEAAALPVQSLLDQHVRREHPEDRPTEAERLTGRIRREGTR